VATAYLAALATIACLYTGGAILGVSIPAGRWIEMTLLILVGLVPFIALGILYGHLLTTDSIGPAMGGTTAVLSLLGGVWFPIGGDGVLHDVAQALPSYWLVAAGRIGIGAEGWGPTGWAVMAAWTVALTMLARRAYRRDTQRV
jgi:ABC-2 type transport system permease protein